MQENVFVITLHNAQDGVSTAYNEKFGGLATIGESMSATADRVLDMIVDKLPRDGWADGHCDHNADGDFMFQVAVTTGDTEDERVLHIETGKNSERMTNLAAARSAHRALVASGVAYQMRAAVGA